MEETEQKMNVGGAFIILIIIVIALSSFALLSVRSSANELRLAEKSASSVKEFYKLDTKAVDIMAKTDAIVKMAENRGLTESSFDGVTSYKNVDIENGTVRSIEYDVTSGRKVLSVKLTYQARRLKIDKWRLTTKTSDSDYTIELPD